MAEFTIGNWIPACQSLRAHTKRKRLSRRLDIGLHEAIGVLFCLWWWALEEAEDGDLSGFSDQDIADGADWGGDAAALVAALTEAGFLSQDRQLVNWTKFVGRLLAQRDARREAERLRQQRYRQSIRDRLNGHAPVTRDTGVTGDVVTGDSPSGHAPLRPDNGASHADVTRDFALNSTGQDRTGERGSFASPGEGAGAPDADQAPAVEPPPELREFDARLRRMPGYNPSADFYRIVLEKYAGRLDLNEQAFLMAEWQADPTRNKKKRKGTTLFVVNWLKGALREAGQPIPFTARAAGRQNGRAAAAPVADRPPDAWPDGVLLDDDGPPDVVDLDDVFGGR